MRETIESGETGEMAEARGGADVLSLSAAQQAYLSAARSLLVERMQLAGRFGLDQFGGQRRIYDTLGYPVPGTLTFADYRERFERGGIAKRILRAAPRAMGWTGMQLVERPVSAHQSERKRAKRTGEIDKSGYTPFENEWDKFSTRLSVGSIIERADIIAGLGEYSVIYIGVREAAAKTDPNFLEKPLPRLRSSDDIVYLRVLSQENCYITEYVGDNSSDDPSDERYGLPKFYSVRLAGSTTGRRSSIGRDQGDANTRERKVHWSRIIHITQNPLYDEVFSRPELEAIWNYLVDLDKLAGGGSEAFWREAVNRVIFDIDKDIKAEELNAIVPGTNGKTAKEVFKDSLEEMEHELKKYMIGRGVTPKSITSSPKEFHNSARLILTLIASTVEQPQRILYGSEAGHLASTQDQENANSYVFARRAEFGNRAIRLFADRLISVNGLPKPTKYEPWWPNDNESTDQEKASIVSNIALANLHQHQADGTIIRTSAEMRDEYYDLDPLEIDPTAIATSSDVVADAVDSPQPDNLDNPVLDPGVVVQ